VALNVSLIASTTTTSFRRSSLSRRDIRTRASIKSLSDDDCWPVLSDAETGGEANRGIPDNSLCAFANALVEQPVSDQQRIYCG
jgi:hypothetical protein